MTDGQTAAEQKAEEQVTDGSLADGQTAEQATGESTTQVVIPEVLPPAEQAVVPADGPTAIEPMMREGETRFGVTCAGPAIGSAHWLADSSVCGDMVMALPSAVVIAGRTREAGSIAVDMCIFLDAVIEGAARLCGVDGIVEAASLPAWAVARLFGTFPVLRQVYDDAMDQVALTVEAAAMKAAIGMKVQHKRKMQKTKNGPEGTTSEESEETLDKVLAPDPALSKLILTSRMKNRYKDDAQHQQAVQINIIGPEANL